MSDREYATQVLLPILEVLKNIDPSAPDATAQVTQLLPLDDPRIVAARNIVKAGIEGGWLTPREAGGIRFGRVAKPSESLYGFSIDAVDMDCAGPGHVHPNGEFDLSFSLDGNPTFENHGEGWVVLPPGSWHVPTVENGRMGILYFLPEGAIQFGPKPK